MDLALAVRKIWLLRIQGKDLELSAVVSIYEEVAERHFTTKF